MKNWATIVWIAIGILLGVYLILFGLANTEVVGVDLLVVPKGPEGQIPTALPLYAVIGISFGIGALIVGAFWLAAWVKRSRERRRLLRRVDTLEQEVAQLRNAPLTGGSSAGDRTSPPSSGA